MEELLTENDKGSLYLTFFFKFNYLVKSFSPPLPPRRGTRRTYRKVIHIYRGKNKTNFTIINIANI